MGSSQSSPDEAKSPKELARRGASRRERQARPTAGDDSNNAAAGPGRSESQSSQRQKAHVKASAPPHPQSLPHPHPLPHSHPNPTATLIPSSVAATTSTTTSTALGQHTHSASPASTHSRARSVTTSAYPGAKRDDSASSRQSNTMGQSDSRHRPPSRSHTLPPPPTEKPPASQSPQPVDVPQRTQAPEAVNEQEMLTPPMNSPFYTNDFSRPPRLPLPIERDPEPTSPIATPLDAVTPMETADEVELGRPGSMLSSTTLDDDEVADIETFTLEHDPYMQKVLTTLEWKGDARTVYVTGTFVRWEKKFRMQKMTEADGSAVWRLTAPLPTGTHHLKFLVDGEMSLSDQYPTTVDYTASLVNYVEIAGVPASTTTATQPAAPAEPMPIPGASPSETDAQTSRPLDIRTASQTPGTTDPLSSTLHEAAPEATHFQPASSAPPASLQQPAAQQALEKPPTKVKKTLPRPKYTNEIPEYLLHVDLYNAPEDERYRRAMKATSYLPAPPSLPMFMSKSILNAATPHKDDASVLTMPNHTVLNHLATSSIRQGVLATSGTTRYKRKFLTTIMYKPTSDAG